MWFKMPRLSPQKAVENINSNWATWPAPLTDITEMMDATGMSSNWP